MWSKTNVSLFILISITIIVTIFITFFQTSGHVNKIQKDIISKASKRTSPSNKQVKTTTIDDHSITDNNEKDHEQHENEESERETQKKTSEVPSLVMNVNKDKHRPSCTNLLNPDQECHSKLISSPKFSDFKEYSWPNESQILKESPVRYDDESSFVSPVVVTARRSHRDRQKKRKHHDKYVQRQIKELECSYDGDDFDDDDINMMSDGSRIITSKSTEPTVVRIYVPWKSYNYMTPYPLLCPWRTKKGGGNKNSNVLVDCQLTNSKDEITAGLKSLERRKNENNNELAGDGGANDRRKNSNTIDAYLVDSNGAYVNEIYDWVRNPLQFVLIAFNTENIEGRRAALMKGYGLRYLAKPWNSTWWSYFHITASYQRYSQVMVNFFHWSLCRDESFARGYFHWANAKAHSFSSTTRKAHSEKKSLKQKKNALGDDIDGKTLPSKATLLSFRGKLQHKTVMANSSRNQAPILFFVRNCDFASHRRNGFMKRLGKFIDIDSVGKCHRNRHPKSIRACDGMKGNRRSCMIADFKFYLSIENSISLDYVSEKVFEPLLVGTIPIYLGAPNVVDFLPARHSAILASDFSSLKQLANYIKCIARNQTLYEYYTSWYERPLLPRFEEMVSWPFAPLCDVCLQIAELKKKKRGNREEILKYFDQDKFVKVREPGVSGEVLDYERNSQAPLKECLF